MTKHDKIGQALKAGQAVILPTETVYGLFARALDKEAVAKLYALKGRPKEKALNLNVASLADIYTYSTHQPPYLKRLVDHFLPGPLTIILPANDQVPVWVNAGLATVGFRMPSHPKTLAYIKDFGPLVGPSANLSGHSSGRQYEAIQQAFQQPLLGLADDAFLTGQDSTIVDLSGEKAKILRQGSITQADLQAAIPELRFED
ncbi:L-threonylcarbamoyladenylate synthase [Streptococcus sp. DD12]|uniref:L-threonylcarbamoyladenylate synthase n=1 Tax=Streptococcus sp. DD12 TaxID=1777880 RepID=UPI000792F87D|nr:L-threonylcarbamoyladenylate synthase [Streptococcus sp. DD12]KXT76515.1 YrdC/Sua5 family protein [Streptococcus sp. DD12]